MVSGKVQKLVFALQNSVVEHLNAVLVARVAPLKVVDEVLQRSLSCGSLGFFGEVRAVGDRGLDTYALGVQNVTVSAKNALLNGIHRLHELAVIQCGQDATLVVYRLARGVVLINVSIVAVRAGIHPFTGSAIAYQRAGSDYGGLESRSS